MLLFGASLISDLLYYGKSKYVTYKSHKRFDDYVSNLSGRKLEIVKAIYEGKGRSARIRINDTDLRELVARNIIVQATESSAVFPNEENLSNPPMYFLLQPRTLDLIEKQPDFFAKRKWLNVKQLNSWLFCLEEVSSISDKKLTNKQQAFIDAYCSVSKFNATDAARRAGYKHPHVQGAQNLSKLSSQIAQRMQELKEKSGASIMSQQEVAQRLSRFADGSIKVLQLANNGKLVDAPVSPKDQLKALELLGKSYGMFVDKKEINGNLDIDIGMGDYDDDED